MYKLVFVVIYKKVVFVKYVLVLMQASVIEIRVVLGTRMC